MGFGRWFLWIISLGGEIGSLGYLWPVLSKSQKCSYVHGLLFVVSAIFATIASNFANAVHKPDDILFDVGFSLLPEPPLWMITVSDTQMNLVIITTLLNSLLFYKQVLFHKFWQSFSRIQARGSFLRGSVVWLTSLPGPEKHCEVGRVASFESRVILSNMTLTFGHSKNCGD
jgi:hypothetical protein